MIGHYLLALTTEQEDWILTRPMAAFYGWPDGVPRGPCLLQRAHAEYRHVLISWGHTAIFPLCDVGTNFDALCWRFGAPRVNAAIRARILTNRLWRMLAPVSRETAGMGSGNVSP